MQRMTALGELVSTTTHEFNNVLMTIINYAKMGVRHQDQATRDKAFDKINTAGMRAAKITNHMRLSDESLLFQKRRSMLTTP